MGELSTPGASWADARARALARLGDAALDRAPAGVDAAAAPLVGAINGRAAYATTSTCAGRCAVYAAPAGAGRKRAGAGSSSVPRASRGGGGPRRGRARGGRPRGPPASAGGLAQVRAADRARPLRDPRRGAAARAGMPRQRPTRDGLQLADVPTVAVGHGRRARLSAGRGDARRRAARAQRRRPTLAAETARRLAAARVALDGLARAVASELGDDAGPGAAVAAPAAAVVVPRARARPSSRRSGARRVRQELLRRAGGRRRRWRPADARGLRAVEARDRRGGGARGRGGPVVAAPDLPPSGRRAGRRGAGRRSPGPPPRPLDGACLGPPAVDAARRRRRARAAGRTGRRRRRRVLVRAVRAAGASRVFRDAEIAPDGFRSSRRVLLHGPGGPDASWVVVREAGVAYGFDATHTMFARGNG